MRSVYKKEISLNRKEVALRSNLKKRKEFKNKNKNKNLKKKNNDRSIR